MCVKIKMVKNNNHNCEDYKLSLNVFICSLLNNHIWLCNFIEKNQNE